MPKAASQKTAAPSAKICGKSANFHAQGGGLVKSRKRLHTHAMAQLARSKWVPALLRERALRPATNGRLKLCYELQCSWELPLTAQLQAASYSTATSCLLQHSYELELTSCRLRVAHLLDDAVGKLLQRQNLLGNTSIDDGLWHTIDHAGVLILCPDDRALAL